MVTFIVILLVIVFLSLLLVSSVQPKSSELTLSELTRRAARSKGYKAQLDRELLLPDILVLLRIKTALLFVLTIILSFAAFGWFIGCVIAVMIAIFYPVFARGRAIHRLAQQWYERYEPKLLQLVQKFQAVFHFLRDTSLYDIKEVPAVTSKEELIELIERSTEVIDADQRQLLMANLAFSDKQVSMVMRPKKTIKFIDRREFLGPLVLDELYTQGHSRLPVTDGDLDHVVGILHLRDLLSLDIKRSTTAGNAMEQKVYYIREDDSLMRALSVFITVRHHLFIVVNDAQETVGLVTLEDVIEALIGRKILDEGDRPALEK